MITKTRGGPGAGIYKKGKQENRRLKPITNISSLAYSLFPNLVMPIAENIFSIVESVPITVSRSRMNLHILQIRYDGDEGADLDAMAQDAIEAFRPVVTEDIVMLSDMHAPMSGGGIDSVQFSYAEQFLYNHEQEVDRVIGVENIPEHLRVVPVDLPMGGLARS